MNVRNKTKCHLFNLFTIFTLLGCADVFCLASTLFGTVTSAIEAQPVKGVDVFVEGVNSFTKTDKTGNYAIKGLEAGQYTVRFFQKGYKTVVEQVAVSVDTSKIKLDVAMPILNLLLDEINVTSEKEDNQLGLQRLRAVEGTAIYASKKNELIFLDKVVGNLATNNSRQVFAKVAGLNIWESDGGGLQLGIGGRGLSPNRTSNFNTRQNGYDISADALGYPESYYTPPTEAIERIELVRGASSLQYGTQFGGMLNFKLKKGAKNKPIELLSRNTVGSFGLVNSFTSLGGTLGKKDRKLNYYTFYQYKKSAGWRPNSDFDAQTAHAALTYSNGDKWNVGAEYTKMRYLAHQPGGLTDLEFEEDARQSNRERNWFKVDWNLLSLTFDYRFSDKTKLNLRNFGLIGSRQSLGFLGSPDNVDPIYLEREQEIYKQRNLISGKFHNFGSEARLLHRYYVGNNPMTALFGVRYYQGNTISQQGQASSGFDADFTFLNPNNLEGSDYVFPSRNLAVFAENVFSIGKKISITPGIRYEYINTTGEGHYRQVVRDLADNVILDTIRQENFARQRSFALLGLGMSYRPKADGSMEVYANISQNYRAVNFNDFKIVTPILTVDENLQDESGFNADLGFRGNHNNIINYDASLFLLSYNNRIGEGWLPDAPNSTQRFRTNIADSQIVGLESFVEVDALKLFRPKAEASLSIYANLAFLYSTNTRANISFYEGKKVELVPPITAKTGINYSFKGWQTALQFAYTHEHFSDPTNATNVSSGTLGLIPSYYVADFSMSYEFSRFKLAAGINNLTNNKYFTRRATGYPGPGILPSDGRSFYTTLQFCLN